MKPSCFITAKELAPILEMKPPKLLLCEESLGLRPLRDPNFGKPVRWFRNKALACLIAKGYNVEF